jgi:hypothetical protein
MDDYQIMERHSLQVHEEGKSEQAQQEQHKEEDEKKEDSSDNSTIDYWIEGHYDKGLLGKIGRKGRTSEIANLHCLPIENADCMSIKVSVRLHS